MRYKNIDQEKKNGVVYTPKYMALFVSELMFENPTQEYEDEIINILDSAVGSYVIIMTVVKSLIKSRVLVLLQNNKTLKNSDLCVI